MPDVVVKVGGGLLAAVADLDRVLTAIAALAQSRRTLVVPGGGPFADAVRRVDERIGLPDDAAHWMAVLAMDQYAHLIAARLPHGVVVSSVAEALVPGDANSIPVLAPSRWLQEADPLPHTWDVASDSIAAWVAGAVDARVLVLVKPAGAANPLVDGYFAHALPGSVQPIMVTADRAAVVLSELAQSLSAAGLSRP
jgi:aspartokinase-like uncharacterized kinase